MNDDAGLYGRTSSEFTARDSSARLATILPSLFSEFSTSPAACPLRLLSMRLSSPGLARSCRAARCHPRICSVLWTARSPDSS